MNSTRLFSKGEVPLTLKELTIRCFFFVNFLKRFCLRMTLVMFFRSLSFFFFFSCVMFDHAMCELFAKNRLWMAWILELICSEWRCWCVCECLCFSTSRLLCSSFTGSSCKFMLWNQMILNVMSSTYYFSDDYRSGVEYNWRGSFCSELNRNWRVFYLSFQLSFLWRVFFSARHFINNFLKQFVLIVTDVRIFFSVNF